MCILIWRGRFCVIDELLHSNQLVIGAQLLNNAFIRPCDVFNGSPVQCKYVWSVLMSLLWASLGKMAHLTLWHYCTIGLVYTELASKTTNAPTFLQIVMVVIMISSFCLIEEARVHVFGLSPQLVFPPLLMAFNFWKPIKRAPPFTTRKILLPAYRQTAYISHSSLYRGKFPAK